MKQSFVMIAFVCAAFGAWGSGFTNTLMSGSSDWTKAMNYVDASRVPGAGDVVIIPSGMVQLNASSDADSLNLVKSLARIILATESSRLEINVGGRDDVTLNLPITAARYVANQSHHVGPLVKLGSGTLTLASATTDVDYFSQIIVSGGALRVLPGTDVLNPALGTVRLGSVSVDAAGTFYLPSSDTKSITTQIRALSGSGTVTNGMAKTAVLTFVGTKAAGDVGVFSGNIAGGKTNSDGDINVQLSSGCDSQTLTGGRSMFRSDIGIGGSANLSAAQLGLRKGPSSLGCASNIMLHNNGVNGLTLCATVPETTDHGIVIYCPTENIYPAFLDGGTFGGVTFTGQWQQQYQSQGGRNLILKGSNPTPCVVAGNFSDQFDAHPGKAKTPRGHGIYIRKEGTGVWCMKDNYVTTDGHEWRNLHGGIAIAEGTLQVDTLADKGYRCSVGFMTNLTDGVAGADDMLRAHKVDYAFLLGGTTSDGRTSDCGWLEYVGTQGSGFTDRPIALATNGGLLNNTGAAFVAGPVYSVGKGESTLYLDGVSPSESVVRDVRDGTTGAKVSVVKRGAGTWYLGGNQTFSGDLLVEGGELVVRNPNKFTWYKMTVTALAPSTGDDTFALQEIGLFDANGIRQNMYLTATNAVAHAGYVGLAPGTCQFGTEMRYIPAERELEDSDKVKGLYKLTLDRLFDGGYVHEKTYGATGHFVDFTNYYNTALDPQPVRRNRRPTQGDPTTWVPIVMRLKDGARPIAGYDYANVPGAWSPNSLCQSISNYIISASIDGVTWETLDTYVRDAEQGDDRTYWYHGNCWVFESEKGLEPGQRRCEAEDSKKMAFDYSDAYVHTNYRKLRTEPDPNNSPIVLNNVRSVGVTNGGKLRVAAGDTPVLVRGLKLDAKSGGTISGFTFAESGTIDVTNQSAEDTGVQLPATFENCSGMENLELWSVAVNGVVQGALKAKLSNGHLVLLSGGALMIIR